MTAFVGGILDYYSRDTKTKTILNHIHGGSIVGDLLNASSSILSEENVLYPVVGELPRL
jgi:hypothetical protein